MTGPADHDDRQVPPPVGRDPQYWRERMLRALLLSTCALGLFAYVPSIWLLLGDGHWPIVLIDTLLYGWILAVTLMPRVSYGLRAASIFSLPYILGITLIIQVGLQSGGLNWLGSGPPIVAVLIGLRAAYLALAANLVIILSLGAAMALGWVSYAPETLFADRGLAVFLVGGANSLLLSAAIALSIGVLLRGLEEGHHELVHEIEERTRAEAEREHLEAKLRESHKLEAVGRLASGVAHDFNNLLVPILANAEELRRVPGTPQSRSALDDIVVSAERGRDLVRRVLAFSRRAVTTRAAVCVADVLRETAQLLRAGLSPNVQIVVAIDAPDAVVLADPVELHQVVMNLATNGAHAMRGTGGRLTLGLHADPVTHRLTIAVRDTGEGMSATVRARVFEPFFTTKPLGEGSGLGLSTVHAIVRDLTGDIDIESERGVGTVVRVTLPGLAANVVPPPPLVHQAPASAPRRARIEADPYRVLVVDDDLLVLRTSGTVLTRLGYDVVTMSDPRAALVYLREHITSIDLLLTDKAMPGLDGLELARHARAARAGLPIVIATGFLDDDTVTAVRRLNRGRVITKPYRVEDLAAAVSAAIAGTSDEEVVS